ncbi:ADA2-beta [Intoshia linei]|uniref:ADA2-beta n=1 Tax=Intoshia linei TaxID=1819745 RepID=A0A177BB56_9BILA|nr:ADA2-beta [Intoshia linei]
MVIPNLQNLLQVGKLINLSKLENIEQFTNINLTGRILRYNHRKSYIKIKLENVDYKVNSLPISEVKSYEDENVEILESSQVCEEIIDDFKLKFDGNEIKDSEISNKTEPEEITDIVVDNNYVSDDFNDSTHYHKYITVEKFLKRQKQLPKRKSVSFGINHIQHHNTDIKNVNVSCGNESIIIENTDASHLPNVVQVPSIGDRIAFKELDLIHGIPKMSNLKKAIVVSCRGDEIDLEIDKRLYVQGEPNYNAEEEKQVTRNWKDLKDIKLISKSKNKHENVQGKIGINSMGLITPLRSRVRKRRNRNVKQKMSDFLNVIKENDPVNLSFNEKVKSYAFNLKDLSKLNDKYKDKEINENGDSNQSSQYTSTPYKDTKRQLVSYENLTFFDSEPSDLVCVNIPVEKKQETSLHDVIYNLKCQKTKKTAALSKSSQDQGKLEILIKCTECDAIQLCLMCFSLGVKIGMHDNNHPYKIRNTANEAIFYESRSWSKDEELKLLDSIERFGLGNWSAIATNIGNDRTNNECERHYLTHYIFGAIGKLTLSKEKPNIIDHTIGKCEKSESQFLDIQQNRVQHDLTASDRSHLRFMPYRDDYERLFDNDAESIISKLECMNPIYSNGISQSETVTNSSDSNECVSTSQMLDLENRLKWSIVRIYRHKQRRRNRLKQIARRKNVYKQYLLSLPEEEYKTLPIPKKNFERYQYKNRHLEKLTCIFKPSKVKKLDRNFVKEAKLLSCIRELVSNKDGKCISNGGDVLIDQFSTLSSDSSDDSTPDMHNSTHECNGVNDKDSDDTIVSMSASAKSN